MSHQESAYKSLLLGTRLRESTILDRSLITQAESDRGRVLFCPAFRRLQQKAQVFSMEPNAAVRSRLTHSLEVSQIGRFLSDEISKKLEEDKLISEDESKALSIFVETACLMHDIGNPPFGHFGEYAISQWFSNQGKKILNEYLKRDQDDPESDFDLSDFINFDGNPQGLRIVTKLQRNNDEYGLNLTLTTLASYIKYTRCSDEEKPDELIYPFGKKIGFFKTEKDILEKIRKELIDSKPIRFPLAYIMEAADDIAYSISDLEDSIEKGIITNEKTFLLLSKACEDKGISDNNTIKSIINCLQETTFTDFRTKLTTHLVRYAKDQYIINHNEILSGKNPSLIKKESPEGKILEIIKNHCKTYVYSHSSVEKIELGGYRTISGILDSFSCLLSASRTRFEMAIERKEKDDQKNPIVIEKKLLTLFPKNYIEAYKFSCTKIQAGDNVDEWLLRAHLITDFVCGMTDDYSVEFYRNISGMNL